MKDDLTLVKMHALVFTAVLSRYCLVYLTFSQTTAAVIAGCEAAWAFFGGMSKVLVVSRAAETARRACAAPGLQARPRQCRRAGPRPWNRPAA